MHGEIGAPVHPGLDHPHPALPEAALEGGAELRRRLDALGGKAEAAGDLRETQAVGRGEELQRPSRSERTMEVVKCS